MNTTEIVVIGLVQGVFFRKYTAQKATELGINGYVKNLKNGNVFIAAQGNPQTIELFISWYQMGSPKSKVSHIEVKTLDYKEVFYGFEVRYI